MLTQWEMWWVQTVREGRLLQRTGDGSWRREKPLCLPWLFCARTMVRTVGQGGLEQGSWKVSPTEPGGGISTCLASGPPSLPQQLSQDPLPAELLAPLTYISLVGCSISIVASLLTVLLYFLTRYLLPQCQACPPAAAPHSSFFPTGSPRVG